MGARAASEAAPRHATAALGTVRSLFTVAPGTVHRLATAAAAIEPIGGATRFTRHFASGAGKKTKTKIKPYS